MYSNEQIQIRQGLTNFIGALIKSSPYEKEKDIKQNIIAILIEESIKIAQNDNIVDLYCIKPLIKGLEFVINQRIQELGKIEKLFPKETEQQKNKYINILNLLSSFENLK